MKRICFTLQVKPDRIEEYKQRHKHVWPEMSQALRSAGWTNYSLFLRPDGLLVGYVETEDFAAAIAAMNRTDVNTRWQSQMQDLFVGGRPDKTMCPMEEVFHLP